MSTQDCKVGAAKPLGIAEVKKYLKAEIRVHCLTESTNKKLQRYGFCMSSNENMHLTEVAATDEPRAL